jgi:hypothetical protein
MAAILKILKIKSTILSDDLFLCQVSKEGIGWTNFTVVAMETKKKGDLRNCWIPFFKLRAIL